MYFGHIAGHKKIVNFNYLYLRFWTTYHYKIRKLTITRKHPRLSFCSDIWNCPDFKYQKKSENALCQYVIVLVSLFLILWILVKNQFYILVANHKFATAKIIKITIRKTAVSILFHFSAKCCIFHKAIGWFSTRSMMLESSKSRLGV